jgi:small subunit ribosomal protein S6e
MMRGKEVAPDIVQINTVVAEYGSDTIEKILGGDEEPAEEVEAAAEE